MIYRFFVPLIIAVIALSGSAGAASMLIGSASIHAPAVILQTNEGALTTITLNVTSGDGSVDILGPQTVGNSTIGSAKLAAQYATSYLGLNLDNYNFTYYILNETTNVSGPSAGAAMTLLGISALTHKQLRQDFTITGTINSNGNIGEIGGIYDKAGAAKRYGMDFVLVPAVPNTSSEDELYYLVQSTFNIPLVQVSNISSAAQYAFNASMNPYMHETYYDFYTNYSANKLPEAPLTCSNNCSALTFLNLTLYTFNFTARQINVLSKNSSFINISRQLSAVLNQSRAIASKGYIYTGADFAFLDYINAYYFSQHSTSIQKGIGTLDSIRNSCYALSAPQLTSSNYEYVLGGELRQAWANFTINSTISLYNLTAIDTDGVLNDLYSGAEAEGWCTAAGFVYNASTGLGGTPVMFSSSIKSIAASRLERASSYPGLYLATAAKAYDQGNYALAILDSDYAYALGFSTNNMTTGQLDSSAYNMSANATYGVWATQYANEARFFVYESGISRANATLARNYAAQAYSVALLAEQLSNDTSVLSHSFVATTPQQSEQQLVSSINELSRNISSMQNELYIIALIEIVAMSLFAVIIILFMLLLNKQKHADAHAIHAHRRMKK